MVRRHCQNSRHNLHAWKPLCPAHWLIEQAGPVWICSHFQRFVGFYLKCNPAEDVRLLDLGYRVDSFKPVTKHRHQGLGGLHKLRSIMEEWFAGHLFGGVQECAVDMRIFWRNLETVGPLHGLSAAVGIANLIGCDPLQFLELHKIAIHCHGLTVRAVYPHWCQVCLNDCLIALCELHRHMPLLCARLHLVWRNVPGSSRLKIQRKQLCIFGKTQKTNLEI